MKYYISEYLLIFCINQNFENEVIKMDYEEFVNNLVGMNKENWGNGKYIAKWSFAITSYALPRVNAQLEIAKGRTKKQLLKKKEHLKEEHEFLKRRLGELQKSTICRNERRKRRE